jgi:fructuronate reductase
MALTMARLSSAALSALAPHVARPAYDRSAVMPGIVHLGPGAFARAHIASYVERLLPADPRWGMVGVALRHGADVPALAAQDFLYTLEERDAPPRYRVMGALTDGVVAPAQPDRARAYLASPATRLITLTVTEKGYCLGADGALDIDHPDIARDLRGGVPVTLHGWLLEALAQRRAMPPVIMSCDNLADNGGKLGRAMIAFAQAAGQGDLARWIADEVRFAGTMVDSITPAPDDGLRARVAAAIGLEDAAPVQREPFTQWVIADTPGLPDLASVGAQITTDVRAFERAKLRLLNGAHSALAYMGLARGHETVADAMGDAVLAQFVERMMREEIAPTLSKGPDIGDYISSLLARLRNRAIAHRLIQIASDGSQKLPYRLLETIADRIAAGAPIDLLCVPVAAWMRFVIAAARRGAALNDPQAQDLARVAQACTGQGAGDVPRFLALNTIFPRDLAGHAGFTAALAHAYGDQPA